MKRILLLFLSVLMITLMGCSKPVKFDMTPSSDHRMWVNSVDYNIEIDIQLLPIEGDSHRQTKPYAIQYLDLRCSSSDKTEFKSLALLAFDTVCDKMPAYKSTKPEFTKSLDEIISTSEDKKDIRIKLENYSIDEWNKYYRLNSHMNSHPETGFPFTVYINVCKHTNEREVFWVLYIDCDTDINSQDDGRQYLIDQITPIAQRIQDDAKKYGYNFPGYQ